MESVPVVDVGPLVSDAGAASIASAAAAIDAACRASGFFYVVGHGVDDALQHELEDVARRFFALPEDEKAAIAMANGGRAWRGWFPVGGELTGGEPDRKEGVYFGAELGPDHPRVAAGVPLHGRNLFPARPERMRPVVLAYLDEMTRLAQAVLGGLAVALGLEREWFATHLTADPTILFRIFHYPPAPPDDEGWGVGEHTDYGLLTILRQDDHDGLQVHTGDRWVDAPPIPGSFVCNLGDMLEKMTAGRYRSTPHRVRNTSGAGRLSFPFFFDPSWDAEVEAAVQAAGSDAAGRPRWDGADVHEFAGTYGDYLLRKVAKVFPDLGAGLLP